MFKKILLMMVAIAPSVVSANSYKMVGVCAVQYFDYRNQVHLVNLLTVDSMNIGKGKMYLWRGATPTEIPLKSVEEAKALMNSFATCLNGGTKVSLE